MSAAKVGSVAGTILGCFDPRYRGEAHERGVDMFRDAMNSGIPAQGPFVPNDALFGQLGERAGIDSGTASTGGPFKFTKPGDTIPLLRNRSVALRLGATFETGLTGPFTHPKIIGASTAYWGAENPGADTTDSNLTTSTVALAFKTLMATTSYSTQALFSAAGGNFDLEAIIRADLAAVIALAMDLGALNGSGNSNQPLGLLNNTAISTYAMGTNGAALASTDLAALEYNLAANNADVGNIGIATTPAVRKKTRTTAKNSTGSGFLWEQDALLDFPALASTQLPANLTKGTSTTVCSALIFGAWDSLIIGQWTEGLELVVDRFSKKKQGMVEVSARLYCDVNVRHPESFQLVKDVLTT